MIPDSVKICGLDWSQKILQASLKNKKVKAGNQNQETYRLICRFFTTRLLTGKIFSTSFL